VADHDTGVVQATRENLVSLRSYQNSNANEMQFSQNLMVMESHKGEAILVLIERRVTAQKERARLPTYQQARVQLTQRKIGKQTSRFSSLPL